MAESEATKVFSKIDVEINSAHHQWNTYADILGAGYNDAYLHHKEALDEIFRARMAGKEILYFLFSGIVVGWAGGLAGGMMIPWVEQAGKEAAKKFFVEVTRGVVQEEAKRAANAPLKWLETTHFKKPSGDFQPAGNEPLQYYLGIKSELGLCFSLIRDGVKEFKRFADNEKLSAQLGEMMLGRFRQCELLRDQPSTADMPDKRAVHREAEIAMWIAWSNVFNIAYWKVQEQDASDGIVIPGANTPTLSLKEYDPILARLNDLEVGHLVSMYVEPAFYRGGGPGTIADLPYPRRIPALHRPERVLSIPQLRVLGPSLKTPFLSRVDAIIANPKKTLSEMAKLPPIYKKQ